MELGSGQFRPGSVPETVGYAIKRVFLGKPLITSQLKEEKLGNVVALGVLSPDAISSSAYGTEEILLQLLPYAGLAAFSLVLPITGVILLILILVAASYRQVLLAYTQSGGSYVVARENFGPRVAQVAAAALLIDYVVTVAVQTAAGTVAVASSFPALGPYSLEITVGAVLLICFVNLRGLREAGRPFAVPTYFFTVMIVGMIITGLIKQFFLGGLPRIDAAHLAGAVPIHTGSGLIMGASILIILRAFANGGSSLTGVEAISNTVGALKEPAGQNGRKVLTRMACILGFLVAGVSYLAFVTHATPFENGYPSVLSQEARAVFGTGPVGNVLFYVVQLATALILYTGANTSFNGFPYLASFVAKDRFLPRQLTKRGHRLVFSNGIIVLTVLSIALLIVTGGTVNDLVPFYAIGVFTGFSMAGYGMTKHHLTHRGPGWRRALAINLSAGILSTIVVGIFAVAKFTEGAWLIVIVFPLLVFILIRLNREYRAEASVLEKLRTVASAQAEYKVRKVFLFVDSVDIAVIEALRYARGLKGSELTAIHFMVDDQRADMLRRRWKRFNIQEPLEVIDCPDRRIAHAAQVLVLDALDGDEDTGVTVLLPRRSYSPFLGRLLHDRSADRIAAVVSRIPHAVATIVPYDVQAKIRQVFPNLPEERITRRFEQLRARMAGEDEADKDKYQHPEPPSTVIPIEALIPGQYATVHGRIHEIQQDPRQRRPTFKATIEDDSGDMVVQFKSLEDGSRLQPGDLVRVTGKPHQRTEKDPMIMTDPDCLVVEEQADKDITDR
jgi:amino acid transporter